jgi:hypothetical protein
MQGTMTADDLDMRCFLANGPGFRPMDWNAA